MRPLGVGDLVRVLRSCRLPVEDAIGRGEIERITRGASGEALYWVRGFGCARTERELRRFVTLAEAWVSQDDEEAPR